MILIIVVLVGCDQISKNIVRHTLEYNERIALIDHSITLTKVENTGAFLGLGSNVHRGIYSVLMIVLPLLVLCYAFYYLFSRNHTWLMISGLCLIIGGGIGNLIDRIIYGSVTDFLHFNFGIFQTGIVNAADMSITAGFIVLLLEMYLHREKKVTSDL
jgi:signal peptidase II